MALAAQSLLQLDEVRFVPCHQPPHRSRPQLSSLQRKALLGLALQDYPHLVLDDRELRRKGPSWTVDTLEDFRCEWGDQISLILLMGADAYCQLTTWHRWQSLIELAHIAVLLRPGYLLPQEGVLHEWFSELNSKTLTQLHRSPSGLVVGLQQEQSSLSATCIRERLSQGCMPAGLSASVQAYILEHQLYGYCKVEK